MWTIFSDESGKSHEKSENLYIRSWILTDEARLCLLNYYLNKFKKKNNDQKSLKWADVKRYIENGNSSLIKGISKIFEDLVKHGQYIYVTVSCINIFWNKTYSIIEEIRKINNNIFSSAINKNNNLTGSQFKEKVLNKVRTLIFLNNYEKTHIQNMAGAFSSLPTFISSDGKQDVKLKVNSPQFLQVEWKNMVEEVNSMPNIPAVSGTSISNKLNLNTNFFTNKENIPGIEVADIVAGSIKYFLENDYNSIPLELKNLVKIIKDSFIDSPIPCPNVIFHHEDDCLQNSTLMSRITELKNL